MLASYILSAVLAVALCYALEPIFRWIERKLVDADDDSFGGR